MANYNCTIRTNYFHVKDEPQFMALMEKVDCDGDLNLWTRKEDHGEMAFGFGVYGSIYGIKTAVEDESEDCDDASYDELITGLQECVAENDAIIILEAGYEKMRYVVGSATIITSKECKYLDLTHIAMAEAAKLLCNPAWDTTCEY